MKNSHMTLEEYAAILNVLGVTEQLTLSISQFPELERYEKALLNLNVEKEVYSFEGKGPFPGINFFAIRQRHTFWNSVYSDWGFAYIHTTREFWFGPDVEVASRMYRFVKVLKRQGYL